MDNYGLWVKYGSDKKWTRIITREATGPLDQVIAFLNRYQFLMASRPLTDTGKIKVKIKPV